MKKVVKYSLIVVAVSLMAVPKILTCNADSYTMDLTLDTENKNLYGSVIYKIDWQLSI